MVAAAGDRIIRLVDFFLQPVRERNAKFPPPPQEQPRCVFWGAFVFVWCFKFIQKGAHFD